MRRPLLLGAILVAAALWLRSWTVASVPSSRDHRLRQQHWQVSRWASSATGAVDLPTGAVDLPTGAVDLPASVQAAEARQAVQIALEQLVPAKGDARRGGFDDQRNVKRESDTVRHMLQQDGLRDWRPDPALLPPQAPAGASMATLLSGVPRGEIAWLAFGNAGCTEMLMNWCHHVLQLGHGSRMVVAAYDNELFLTLRERRIPAYNYSGALPPIHFRGTPFLFHRMGFLKALTIREVLLTGRHVLVSDSDVVWLRACPPPWRLAPSPQTQGRVRDPGRACVRTLLAALRGAHPCESAVHICRCGAHIC